MMVTMTLAKSRADKVARAMWSSDRTGAWLGIEPTNLGDCPVVAVGEASLVRRGQLGNAQSKEKTARTLQTSGGGSRDVTSAPFRSDR